jgi:hypothetical protein
VQGIDGREGTFAIRYQHVGRYLIILR